MTATTSNSTLSTATKILGLIGVMAGALAGALAAMGDTQAAGIVGAIAVTATAGAHFTG